MSDLKVIIYNKIEEKVNEYQEKTGATKSWLASKMGMSPQNMYQIYRSKNITLETLIKFSIVLGCEMSDLYEYEIID